MARGFGWRDDPLFDEEWAARRGVGRSSFPPTYGARSWDIPADALAELKAHASIDGTSQDAQIKLYAEAALDRLDGHAGELYQVLQTRTVTQPFLRPQRVYPLIGPVAPSSQVTVQWRADSTESSPWQTLGAGLHTLRTLPGGPECHVTQAGMDAIAIAEDEYIAPLVRLQYTAGMAGDVSGLPADLRVAIYTLARQAYDFRDDTLPGMLSSVPAGVRATIGRYRKDWDF